MGSIDIHFRTLMVNGYNGKEGLKEAAGMIQSLLRDYAESDGGELLFFE